MSNLTMRNESVRVIHTADEPDGLIQRCRFCGCILTDNTNVLSPDDRGLSYWEAGKDLAVYEGNPRHTTSFIGAFSPEERCS